METRVRRIKCIKNGGFTHLLTEGLLYDLIREEPYGYAIRTDNDTDSVFRKELFVEVDPRIDHSTVVNDVDHEAYGAIIHRGKVEAVAASAEKVQAALTTQIGGNHYTKMKIQPFEFSHANGIGPVEHTAIKYLVRWKDKGGIEDLHKARHAIQWLIEYEEKHAEPTPV